MSEITQFSSRITLSAIVDILLVAALIYGLFYLMQGTRAINLLRGILLLVFVTVLGSSLLHLTAFTWLIRNLIPALLVAIPVIFQPELRRALERLGRPGALIAAAGAAATTGVSPWDRAILWVRGWFGAAADPAALTLLVDSVSRAAGALADEKVGALVVLERGTGLQEYIDTGVCLDAEVTVDLLLTIFHKNTRLHDGAVIIRDGRVAAASCTLPITDDRFLDRDLGTRHRAGLGVTEGTDAIAIVVSEQNGAISLANNGRLTRYLEERELYLLLTSLMAGRNLDASPGLPGPYEEFDEPVTTALGRRG